ncbi:hypothetical protein HPHPH44_0897 [Helicobacter pylori Hp H-44]|nr:hypothetical protein HPHPH44_0897 [Helicobacter pylori Hp H-44]
MKTHKIPLGKICFKFRYNRSFNVFSVFYLLAWFVPPCCGVGVSNAPLF